MIPKELKALIDTHCMGKKDIGNIDSEIVNLIMDKVGQLNANPDEVMKYMDEMIKGPTKEEREAAAKAEAERKAKESAERAKREKAEAERKAKEEAERKERERLAAIERAKREKEEAEHKIAVERAETARRAFAVLERIENEKKEAKEKKIARIKKVAYWVFFPILWPYYIIHKLLN